MATFGDITSPRELNVMASDEEYENDEYEDENEWEEATEKDEPVRESDITSQVHPLTSVDSSKEYVVIPAESVDDMKGWETIQSDQLGHEKYLLEESANLDGSYSEQCSESGNETIEETPTTPMTSNNGDQDCQNVLDSLVRLHGRRKTLLPPTTTTTKCVRNINIQSCVQQIDLDARSSRLAAQRVIEYRQLQYEMNEREKQKQNTILQKHDEVRRSNKSMHKALGVADISSQDRLRLLRCERKQIQKHKEAEAAMERQNRWYNATPPRKAAPAHVQEIANKEKRKRQQQALANQQRTKAIQTKLHDLRQQTKAIIAKNTCAYVRGSYLLKRTSKNPDTPEQRDTTPTPPAKEDDADVQIMTQSSSPMVLSPSEDEQSSIISPSPSQNSERLLCQDVPLNSSFSSMHSPELEDLLVLPTVS